MSQVTKLAPREVVRLDHGCVQDLCKQLGLNGAEDVVCRALEDMAERLATIAQTARLASLEDMRKTTRGLVSVADQIGMTTLATVSRDVVDCIDGGDGVALAATHARLMRVGDRSLSALWDTQDLSV
ncbi:hypothetical protein ATO11_12775 [Pseudaestuariivita atlantica]|uniref:Uncharacterized protein n=1 Tax=Pseudaestuariivita atlantica TaxID=1317121 RepID=A0A0L1JNV8_9RHOB|nr:hypothetical protein ATO11_12775 [Pseudaestuariivita atlantica]